MNNLKRINIFKEKRIVLFSYVLFSLFIALPTFAGTTVSNVTELTELVNNSTDGDVILLADDFVSADVSLSMPNVNVVIDGTDKIWSVGTVNIVGDGTGSLTIRGLKIDGTDIGGRLLTNSASKGKLLLENMEFYNAKYGAIAILSKDAEASTVIYKTSIYNNTASNMAPAISLGENSYSVVEINHSTIENNTGTGAGYETGAIASKHYYGKLSINNTLFKNNVNETVNTGIVGGGGGAMSMHYLYGELNISECYFLGNKASGEKTTTVASSYDGGAIYVFDGRGGALLSIDKSTFEDNIAYDDGGALMIQGTGNPGLTTTITSCTFYNNKAYGLADTDYSGGAIQFFKNGGSSKMTNNLYGCTFVGNEAGCVDSSAEQRGGAVGLSGAGLFATAPVTRNACLFISNIVYGADGLVNTASNYKDISNYTVEQAGTLNIVNISKGSDTPRYSLKDIFGNDDAIMFENQSKITVGVNGEIMKTFPIKPGSIADNSYTGTVELSKTDQRNQPRYKDQGAVEMSWIKHEANGGEFNIEAPMGIYDGTFYYEPNEEGKYLSYYTINGIDNQVPVLDGVATVGITPKQGKVLKGWSLYPDTIVEGDFYGIGDSVKYINTNLTLYAVWRDLVVTFNPQGGLFADSSSVAKNIELEVGMLVPEEFVTRDGYIFEGWYKDESYSVLYDFDAPLTEDIVLYAKWTESRNINFVAPDVECYTFDPVGGVYPVRVGECFSFDINYDMYCESMQYSFKVYVDNVLIDPKDVSALKITYEICDITEDKQIRVEAEPNRPTTIIEGADDENRIWGNNGLLHIQLKEASDVGIYNSMGQLIMKAVVGTEMKQIPLADGLYIVRYGNQTKKVMVSK